MERIEFAEIHTKIGKLFKSKGGTWEETYLQGAEPFKRAVANVVNKALRLEGRVLTRNKDYTDVDVEDSLIDMAVWCEMAIHVGELTKQKKKEELTKEIED